MRAMHDLRPSDDTWYDECHRCGILAESAVGTWLVIPCRYWPCPATGEPCVFILDDQRAVCSYCDRDGGAEATDEALWDFAEL